jgi:hypothetical protein
LQKADGGVETNCGPQGTQERVDLRLYRWHTFQIDSNSKYTGMKNSFHEMEREGKKKERKKTNLE